MKWSLKTTYARQTEELKRNKHFKNQTLLGDKSYRYNIKYVRPTN